MTIPIIRKGIDATITALGLSHKVLPERFSAEQGAGMGFQANPLLSKYLQGTDAILHQHTAATEQDATNTPNLEPALKNALDNSARPGMANPYNTKPAR